MVESAAVVIRRAGSGDAAAVAGVGARTFREAFASSNTPEDMAAYLAGAFGPVQQRAEIESPHVRTFIVEAEVPIAFAQVRTGPAPSCVTTEVPVELWRFYIDRQWHGQGIAQRLMAAVLTEAAALGARSIWLGVWEHNERAKAFYRKLGFTPVGAHDFLLGSDLQTDTLMSLTLPPA